MPKSTIFYSWQSDLSNATNRSFIEKALENVAKELRDDDTIAVEPVVDRDTFGVPGAPEIANTIFQKIETATVFVCDVSIIGKGTRGRPVPNPNVLMELGYALKALGPNRVLMVMNEAFGAIEELPFDLRARRVIAYRADPDDKDRSQVRKELESKLSNALRYVFTTANAAAADDEFASTLTKAKDAMAAHRPDNGLITGQALQLLFRKLEECAPSPDQTVEPDDLLLARLDKTKSAAVEFARIAEVIAATKATDAALEAYKFFETIVNAYVRGRESSGNYFPKDEFFRFVGHEWFVLLFASLIKRERWDLVDTLLASDIYVANPADGQAGIKTFEYVCNSIDLLDRRNKRLKLNRICVHGDILRERYQDSIFAGVISFQSFAEADFFLFLRSHFGGAEADWKTWRPWTSLALRETPQFLARAERKAYALPVAKALGLLNPELFPIAFEEARQTIRQWFRGSTSLWFLSRYDPTKFGSRP
jgi:hypothetical protein